MDYIKAAFGAWRGTTPTRSRCGRRRLSRYDRRSGSFGTWSGAIAGDRLFRFSAKRNRGPPTLPNIIHHHDHDIYQNFRYILHTSPSEFLMAIEQPQPVILVTGGTGLVGHAIQHVIETEPEGSKFGRRSGETWVFIGTKDADLRDPEQAAKVFDKYKPTHVIHLAALVGGLYRNMRYKLSFLRDNMLINDNVLLCAHKTGVSKVISCLSTCVFPDEVTYPLDESKIHLGPPHESNYGYAHAKRMVDIANRAYHDEHGSNFTSAIPTNVFGPNDNFDLEDSHVVPALIHKCLQAKRNNTPFVVFGSGRPLRQFIYSYDLAKLFIWQLREYNDIEPVILSVGEDEEVSIKQVADAIVAAVGFEGEYRFDPSRADGQFRKPASNQRLLSLLGGKFEFTPFEVALRDTVQWLVEHYDTDARIGRANPRTNGTNVVQNGGANGCKRESLDGTEVGRPCKRECRA
ncbi:hypothetical protein BC826DRAFT_1013252 [Russula brevipes]|nr:hypothetical protein BC826DRAFT_1013252 [Russula brevipes]